jgi:hypothetical protein
MRRLRVLLLALVACALIGVPAAQAARVETKAVAQDKAAVKRYWTAERMREAIPADKVLSGSFAAGPRKPPKSSASAQQVAPPYTSQPTSTNGKVFFTDDGLNYPAGPPFDGQRQWVCNSPLVYDDTSANPATMGIDCDMTGGSSGGGWIAGGSLTSVNSYGYSTLPNVMFGPYQGSVAQSLYTQAASR